MNLGPGRIVPESFSLPIPNAADVRDAFRRLDAVVEAAKPGMFKMVAEKYNQRKIVTAIEVPGNALRN